MSSQSERALGGVSSRKSENKSDRAPKDLEMSFLNPTRYTSDSYPKVDHLKKEIVQLRKNMNAQSTGPSANS